MDLRKIEQAIKSREIMATDGNHSARLWRVAENVKARAQENSNDDRLVHLMSRVGVLARGLAHDLRSGHSPKDEVATILDQLADLGDLSFEAWSK